MTAEEPPHRVDQVAIRKLGGFNFLDVSQWMALPTNERLRLIKAGVVTFLYEGKETPLRPALEYLKALNSPAAAPAAEESDAAPRPSIAPLPRPPRPPEGGFGPSNRPQQA